MNLKDLIVGLCGLPSVSGREKDSAAALERLIGGAFDEHVTDAVGNQLFIRRCGREGAEKLLIDTHFDEIGMMVTGVRDGGYLTVTNIGGVDTRILEAGEVVIYGKETLPGVIVHVPAHLRGEKKNVLCPITELLIDTGYDKETLEAMVPLGTRVGFRPVYTELANRHLIGKAFDDKACGACAVAGIASVPREELAGDVYCLFSVQEEVGMLGGRTGAWQVCPDRALVMDVSHAAMPETNVVAKMGEGIEISYSALTSRKMTDEFLRLCREKEILCRQCADATNSGTNANRIWLTGSGVPQVLASLPIRSMHSAGESLHLGDAEQLAAAVAVFVREKSLGEVIA